jgi:hypothetical protein
MHVSFDYISHVIIIIFIIIIIALIADAIERSKLRLGDEVSK